MEAGKDVLDDLIAADEVSEIEGKPGRWKWAGPESSEAQHHTIPPVMPGRSKRAGTLLGRVLNSICDERVRRRISRVASRFLGEVEAISRGNVRMMSWEFVPQGQGSKAQGGAQGLNSSGIAARMNLERLEAHMGKRNLIMLEAILVREQSARQIGDRFGLQPKEVLPVTRDLLLDLARAYDLVIAGERD